MRLDYNAHADCLTITFNEPAPDSETMKADVFPGVEVEYFNPPQKVPKGFKPLPNWKGNPLAVDHLCRIIITQASRAMKGECLQELADANTEAHRLKRDIRRFAHEHHDALGFLFTRLLNVSDPPTDNAAALTPLRMTD